MKPTRAQKRPTGNRIVQRRRAAHLVAQSVLAEQASEDFTLFFAQSPDLMCVAGLDGYFQHVNAAWTARLGWSASELEAEPLMEFVHPDDRESTTAEFQKLAAGVTTILFENRYRHRNGSYRWLQWNAWPVPGQRRIHATVRDVTRHKRLETEVLEIADREKERLGRELHDGLCQSLAGIAALSSTLSKRLAADSESDASATAAEITQLLKETIAQARDLARGLGPVDLNGTGLDGALEGLALNVRHLFRVDCTFECDRQLSGLCHEAEAHLFRIAQEAVNNAISHGQADRIELSLGRRDDKGVLSITDDGVGLPVEAQNPDGVGLRTMAYRARLIGGSFEVKRLPRRGTAVTCSFPLPERSDTSEKHHHGSEDA
jgi:PAS domain S-box-containing protein